MSTTHDPARTRLFLKDMPVPRDPARMNGWDYGPDGKSVIFYGSWCEQIRSGAGTGVTAYFGCGTA